MATSPVVSPQLTPFSCNVGVSLTLKALCQDVWLYSLLFSTSLEAGVSGGVQGELLRRIEVWRLSSSLPVTRQSVCIAPRITWPWKPPAIKTGHLQRCITRGYSQWQIQA